MGVPVIAKLKIKFIIVIKKLNYFDLKKIFYKLVMSLDIFFQLGSLLLVVSAGPLVVILLSLRGGNL
jgi:hypothetical protein